jgi:processive 1,2-diacylglycerol beta-glucosyltransferase
VTGSNTILVLYISVGQGHRRAALALQEALREEDPFLRIVGLDLLELWPSGIARLAVFLYRLLVRTAPGIWTYIYDRRGVKARLDGSLRVFHRLIRRRFQKLIEELDPAAVVCTQAFPCALAAQCRFRSPAGFTLVAVPTDFRVHAYWIYPEVDLYLLPSRESVEKLSARGVDPERIRETGIPVRPGFSRTLDPDRMKRKYGLPPELPAVLLMGGGEGTVPLERLVLALDTSEEKFQVAALAGRNRKQYLRLQGLRSRLGRPLTVFGFTDLVEELMAAVEVIVTKPGGLTTAEALVKRLPLVLIDPLPGQEDLNARFLGGHGAAILAGDYPGAAAAAVKLLRDGALRERMLAAMDRIRKPDAARDAARIIISSFREPGRGG